MDQWCDAQRLPRQPEAPWIRVVARRTRGCVELLVDGEADAQTCGRLRTELVAALDDDVDEVRVDLSGLWFCDLAGSDALHDFADEAAVRAIATDLRGMSPLLAFLYDELSPRRVDGADREPLSARTGTSGADLRRCAPALD